MKKSLILVFVILVGLIFIISGCEQYIGQKINKEIVFKEYFNIKQESKQLKFSFDEDQGIGYLDGFPIIYSVKPNLELNKNINQNLQNSQDLLNLREWIKSANTNEETKHFVVLYHPQDGELGRSIDRDMFSINPFFDLPLIRNGRVVYEQGKEKNYTTNFTGDFLDLIPKFEGVQTLRHKTYYFQDLPELDNSENEERVNRFIEESINRLEEYGNDMDRPLFIIRGMLYGNEKSPVFKRWFITIKEYINKEGEPSNHFYVYIEMVSASEKIIKDNDWINGGGILLPTSSKDIGNNIEVHFDNFGVGALNRNGEIWPLNPPIEVTSIYNPQKGGTIPARRLSTD